jgi:glutamine cyclotransferase
LFNNHGVTGTGKLYGLLLLTAASLCVVSCLNGCSAVEPAPVMPQPVPVYTFKVVNTFPHDRQAYTQGLDTDNGTLYEGTGGYGSSTLRKVDLESGRVLKEYKLPAAYFGEGITVCRDALVQLTWRANTGFVYDKNSFNLLRTFSYPTEGWGITYDGKRLIMSDGTSRLYFLDPDNFNATGYIEVHDKSGPVVMLNELEFIKGKIFANVWTTDNVAIIDPVDGSVTGWLDLSGLLDARYYNNSTDVLNGITYDAESDRMFVTGKRWPLLFEIVMAVK